MKTRFKKPGTRLGGPVVKNLPSDTGVEGLIPDLGTKISHAATKPARQRLTPHAPPRGATPKILRVTTETRRSQINKYLNRKKRTKLTRF